MCNGGAILPRYCGDKNRRCLARYYENFRHINSRYEAFQIFLLFLSERFSHLFVYHFFNLILDTI